MATDVILVFAGFGAIIFVGFLGSLLFEKTKIPDILILIFIGLFLGPVLMHYFGIELVSKNVIIFVAPYFAALALVIILFDGGLNLNLDKVMSYLGITILHTGIAFIGTMFATAIICYYFLGIGNFFIGLFLGCILGGVSSAVVLPIIHGVSAKEETKVILTLESVLTDVLCIVTALILIEVLKGGATDTGTLIQHLLSAFILAGFIGLLFGLAWLGVLKRIHGKQFSFMVTIAVLFVLYAAVEYIQVSGAIAALVFGLVLTNKGEVARMFKLKTEFVFEEKIKEFHSEVSFLVRTFFFVYIGWTFTFTFDSWNYSSRLPFNLGLPEIISSTPIYMFIIVLFVLFFAIFLVRYIASSVTTSVNKDIHEDKSFLYSMLPRGLAAAVIASLPFAIPEYADQTSAYFAELSQHKELFFNMAFMMIVISVIATTIGVSAIERSRKKKPEGDEEDDGPDWTEKSRMYRKHTSGSTEPGAAPQTDWKLQKKDHKPKKSQTALRRHPETPLPPPAKNNKTADQPKVPVQKTQAPSKPHPLLKRAEESKSKPVPKKKTK